MELKTFLTGMASTNGKFAEHAQQRLDNLTNLYLGDPEQFWQLCDANNAKHPDELETIGRQIRITLPEGIPGMSND